MKGLKRLFVGCVFLLTVLIPGPGEVQALQTPNHDVVREVATSQKVVALTFDDGPYPNTPHILDTLKKYEAKATFFSIGKRVEWLPDTIRREAAEGHELANHTFNHPSMRKISSEKLHEEIVHASDTMEKVAQVKPVLFRPPGGYYNEMIVSTAAADHCTVVMWSPNLDTKDWTRPGVYKIVQCVLKNVRNGSIVLFHDREPQTTEALEQILPALKKQGYTFVTVSELLRVRNAPTNSH
jgi:peptidoglycan/xylan/chitin deacetylase (PgdA/CDA1 family)